MLLSIVVVSILAITVVYVSLSTTLNINGTVEVSSVSWYIHFDNVQLNSRSATTTAPAITNSTMATFSTTLSKPGDFYEFSIDVVNNGRIDAMINSVTKTPELSDTQKKYLNYIVEYQKGNTTTSEITKTTTGDVYLRSTEAYGNNIICVIPKTSTVVYYGGTGWAKVKYNGITGYCGYKYLK